ncbi:phosphatidylinositol mannoside acyltransferase [Corynebacterium macclintockiae]|uniref:phosphatidylinositol mannoside acyltransferase n=1 Tax=Corynebacterium macclintockiae TaxID=2913501 RepID=UPI00254C092F|nr:phosphatidylinositol mannoside acyltransferase [Corynebacterium macclintockiae]MDK8869173.1 phosphatidylinositol mannoside acyltransferase [Corynebacterium macclintockiae]
MRERLTAAAYIAGWKITSKLPQPVAKVLFEWGADVASQNGKGPEQLRRNLARVVGPENVTRDLVRRSMRSYMRYWREAFQLPAMAGPELAAELNRNFVPGSLEALHASAESGRGTIIALPHAGNWDMAGVWLVHHYGTFTTVAERLKPESLFEAFVEYRESLGFRIIALTGAKVPPLEQMEEVLRGGGTICLMGERDMTGHGVHVDFFGERTSMPAGAALLAQRTGANLFTARVAFRGGSTDSDAARRGQPETWEHETTPVAVEGRELQDIVQEMADNFARGIAMDPQDWHMLQPLWFADLSEARRKRLGLEDA